MEMGQSQGSLHPFQPLQHHKGSEPKAPILGTHERALATSEALQKFPYIYSQSLRDKKGKEQGKGTSNKHERGKVTRGKTDSKWGSCNPVGYLAASPVPRQISRSPGSTTY